MDKERLGELCKKRFGMWKDVLVKENCLPSVLISLSDEDSPEEISVLTVEFEDDNYALLTLKRAVELMEEKEQDPLPGRIPFRLETPVAITTWPLEEFCEETFDVWKDSLVNEGNFPVVLVSVANEDRDRAILVMTDEPFKDDDMLWILKTTIELIEEAEPI